MRHFQPLLRRQLLALGAGAGLLGLSGASTAQVGEKSLRFVLPNATGSGVDAITRGIQAALGKALNLPVVVENQAGAGGILGLQTLARAPADGFTLSLVSNNVVIFPSVMKSLPFAMPDDFTPIAVIGSTPLVLVVNPKVPAKDHKEFAALLKAKPGELNYASGGNGTILHLAGEMYVDEVGSTAKHIPYKGVGQMVTDLIGGQVEFGVAALPSVQQHIKSGALRAIGISSAQRTPAAPEIATIAEQGMPSYQMEAWFGVLGPKGMSAADVKRIHDALVATFNDAGVKELMAKQGNNINIQSPAQAQAYFRSELAKYAKLVKKAGIEAQ